MKITLDLSKSLQENAAIYFEKAKKAKRKLEGLERAMKISEKRIKKHKEIVQEVKIIRKMHWYEKFRWFFSSDGFLCVGGRDATTNEMIIKKHTQPRDLVFHTDMAGSPFIVIKAEGKEIPQTTIEEAAQYTASMSRAWKNGLASLEVFHVKPEQVTKEANAGESLSRGAFMIRGETTYLRPNLELSACLLEDKRLMIAPRASCEKHDGNLRIIPGTQKVSDAAKFLRKLLPGNYDLDEAIRLLPPGPVKIITKK